MRHVASSKRNLDFPRMISVFVDQTEKYLALCDSPQRTEFEFCALLSAWESITLADTNSSHWFGVWHKHCSKRHHGNVGRTLADPAGSPTLSERWQVSQEETTKAYSTVVKGLRCVLKTTLNHYCLGENDPILAVGKDAPCILFQKIRISFKTAKSFASPEGAEVFLLTLIELFEQSFGTAEDSLFSRQAWQSEIRRRRVGGSPQTRTLADVAPAKIRFERQNAFPEKERTEILREMLSSIKRITKEVKSYLVRRAA